MRQLSLILALSMLLGATAVSVGNPASAAEAPPCNIQTGQCPDPPASCVASDCKAGASSPSSPGSTTQPSRGSGGGGNAPCIDINGDTVPCYEATFGWFNPGDSCYYKLLSPSPPPSDPAWEGHYPNGAIYQQTCYWVRGTGGAWAWLATPPPGMPTVTPAQLAQQALSTLHVPDPVMRRSPTETNSDHGTPYTWVNLWTWFWADPASWKVQTARATAGPVWAEVTVTPTQLIIFPGETGTASVTCSGPGRPWTEADGDSAPSGGGCGVVYRHVSAVPITATVAVEWAVTWRGSGGVSGTLPGMRTQSSSAFVVEQIQVVTR